MCRKVLPILPHSCLFDIPDTYKLTLDDKRFLVLDESLVQRKRLLLFPSDYRLDILFDAHTVLMDGTFSKSPLYLSQVYIIHGINHDECTKEEILIRNDFRFCLGVPCIFALMANKKEGTYRHICSQLKYVAAESGKSFSPKAIVTDVESGIISVIKAGVVCHLYRKILVHTIILLLVSGFNSSGLLFSLYSVHSRKIRQVGIQHEYAKDREVRTLFKKPMALAMMPRETIISAFEQIRRDFQMRSKSSTASSLNYFENAWLSNLDI